MTPIDVMVKPFSTSDVIVALKWGKIVNGVFKPAGHFYQRTDLLAYGKRRTTGTYGKASYRQDYHLDIPDTCPVAIASVRRSGLGTTQVDMVTDILYAPEVP